MDLLKDSVKKVYLRYLASAFGSTFISSIYGIVDMAMVGQYHGPQGTAALAVFAPVWNIIFSFGLLAGEGGSVLYAAIRGQGERESRRANGYFSAALLLGAFLSFAAWAIVFFFHGPLLRFFGADDSLLPLALQYLGPILWTIPFFVLGQVLSAFLRNDGSPGLATMAVLAGGIFNVFGDWFFVFHMDMGISGAGLATAMGSVVTLLAALPHFFLKRNTLRFCLPRRLWHKTLRILRTGFSTCIIDLAMGVMTILFNRQIMTHLGPDALAVYGVIVNVSTFVQCCAYSVGQAAQPILSRNYGAGRWDRIRQCLRCCLLSSAVLGLAWTGLCLMLPSEIIRIFMAPTEAVLAVGPAIIRTYAASFLLLPLNVFSTYYFQSVLRPGTAMGVSLARGVFLSGGLIMLLPAMGGGSAVWWAMPLTEALVALWVLPALLKRQEKAKM